MTFGRIRFSVPRNWPEGVQACENFIDIQKILRSSIASKDAGREIIRRVYSVNGKFIVSILIEN
jgi:hypothetical protein